ncbi:MAG: thioesterase family protein [Opitutales bacterium]|nr:thioesterase family protein [Opitutales bacterium]
MVKSVSHIRVRFSETDAMGVVYHSNYLNWFEVARVDLMDSIGMPYKKFAENKIHLPVVDAHLEYKRPAKFDDKLEVVAYIGEAPTVKIKVQYEVLRDGVLLCKGHTTHVFIGEKGTPVKPPKEFLERLRELVKEEL